MKAPRHLSGGGDSPVTEEFPAQRASNAENIPFDDVIMKYIFADANGNRWLARTGLTERTMSYIFYLLERSNVFS